MIRSPRPTASRTHASARSGEPISWSWLTTSAGAPPWSGPLSAPIAPHTAEAMSLRVEVMTRAVKVEALRVGSADDEVGVQGPCGGRGRRLVVQLLEEPGGEAEGRVRCD